MSDDSAAAELRRLRTLIQRGAVIFLLLVLGVVLVLFIRRDVKEGQDREACRLEQEMRSIRGQTTFSC